jgi:hypothetical protein
VRFTVAVAQLNGEVTDRREYTAAGIQADRVGAMSVNAGRSLLAEKVPHPLAGDSEFRVPIDDAGRIELLWRQPVEGTALAAFTVGGRVAFTCAFLPGSDAALDLVSAAVTEEALAGMAGFEGARVRLPPDRPLVAMTPWPPSAAEADARRVLVWVLGLAVALFERIPAGRQPFSTN